MEVYERIRELRKKYLRLSQTDFGNRLGVSRSVIKNIELNALARPDQKLSLIKLICKEFSVNEDWLLNGNEPRFVEPETFSLDKFVRQRGATELELQIVRTYFDLDPDTREMLVVHFKKGLAAPAAEPENKCQTDVPTSTTEQAEAEYIKKISRIAQKEESTVSNTTPDIRKLSNE